MNNACNIDCWSRCRESKLRTQADQLDIDRDRTEEESDNVGFLGLAQKLEHVTTTDMKIEKRTVVGRQVRLPSSACVD